MVCPASGKKGNQNQVAFLAPAEGFEPPTLRLTAACSTVELCRSGYRSYCTKYFPKNQDIGFLIPQRRDFSQANGSPSSFSFSFSDSSCESIGSSGSGPSTSFRKWLISFSLYSRMVRSSTASCRVMIPWVWV